MTLDHCPTRKFDMASNTATSTSMFPAINHLNVMICVCSQVHGCKEHKKTTLDISELLDHYDIEFMTFSCPLSSPNAQTPLSIE